MAHPFIDKSSYGTTLVTDLTTDQRELAEMLVDFNIPKRQADIVAAFYSEKIIRDQMDVFFFEKGKPGTPWSLLKAIETEERQAIEFAIRALEQATEEQEQKQSEIEFLEGLTPGKTRFVSSYGTVFLLCGHSNHDGKLFLEVATLEFAVKGVTGPLEIAKARQYMRLN